MSLSVSKNIILTSSELKDIESYCKLNNFDLDRVIKESYLQGFRIEKYGLLSNTGGKDKKRVETPLENKKQVETPLEKIVIEYVEVEKEIIKEIVVEKVVEVVKEVPVEKIIEKTIEIIKEIPVERIVIQEIIKEVPIEKIVVRTEYITDESKVRDLVEELERLRNKPPQVIETEVIKEIHVPFETIKEVEIIKEIIVEKQNDQALRLQETLSKIRGQVIEKDLKIKELLEEVDKLKSQQGEQKAQYLRGSNLDDKLYK